MGKCIANGYIQKEITICRNCFHADVCGNRDYLSENNCCNFFNAATIDPKRGEWVKTSDRLPQINQHVIVHDGLLSGVGIYRGQVYLSACDWDWWHKPFTPDHWMPLPAPPWADMRTEVKMDKICIYRTTGGYCELHSDGIDFREPCVEGPCDDEAFEEGQHEQD